MLALFEKYIHETQCTYREIKHFNTADSVIVITEGLVGLSREQGWHSGLGLGHSSPTNVTSVRILDVTPCVLSLLLVLTLALTDFLCIL